MKDLEQLLADYGADHRNPVNERMHRICVPLIWLSLLGLLSALPSYSLLKLLPEALWGYAHFGTLLLPFVLLYYLRLSVQLTLGMIVFSVGCLVVLHVAGTLLPVPVWQLSLGLFVIAWAGQFYGHRKEGNRPAFTRDLSLLLVGPAWVLAGWYRNWGWKY